MEEPQLVSEPAVPASRGKGSKKATRPASVKKARMGGVSMSFLIASIAFALGLVLSIIPGNLGGQVTDFFKNNPDIEPIRAFFDPVVIFALEFSSFSSGAIGSLFGELAIIIGAAIVIIAFAMGQGALGKAKKENKKAVMPPVTKLYKYGWLPVLPFLIGTGIFLLLTLLDLADYLSFHMVIATSTTGLAMAYIGSRKKVLAVVFAFASVFYVVMMGIARMADGKPFLAVITGGFITFALVIFTYYSILDIPGQEMVYRHQLTYGPFNEGYKLILDGKAAIKDNKPEGVTNVSAGLEKLQLAKSNAEDINKFHHDLDAFIARIDDITGRIGALLQHQPLNPKEWSYFC